nr:Alpha-ketoglutarate-dependent dioxygenase alkB -like protein 2 [Ipomoea batatas]
MGLRWITWEGGGETAKPRSAAIERASDIPPRRLTEFQHLLRKPNQESSNSEDPKSKQGIKSNSGKFPNVQSHQIDCPMKAHINNGNFVRPRPRGAVGRVPTLSPEKPNQESSNSGRSKSKQGINQIMENQSSKPGQITDEEAQSLNKRKLCSGYKLKEINGINIFFAGSENDASESETNGNLSNRTSVRIVQQAAN